jgi:hypothetical protein
MRRSWKGVAEGEVLSASLSSVAKSGASTGAVASLDVDFVDGFSVVPHPNEAAMKIRPMDQNSDGIRIFDTRSTGSQSPSLLGGFITVLAK